MENDKNPYIDHNSWMNCLGDLEYVPDIQQNPLSTNPPPPPQIQLEINNVSFKEHHKDQHHEIEELICLHQCMDKQLFKRSHSEIIMQDDFFTSNSSSSSIKNRDMSEEGLKFGYKKQKYAKQYIYSKNYRDKKKQQFKLLQQQNRFLKNKIDELQSRLRQKQLEINRLKHHSQEKQLTIEELNRQFLTKVSLFAEKIQTVMEKQEAFKLPKQRKKIVYDQLIKTYDEHGFAGSRKKQILEYYIDEILQVVLRDSQKYLCMLCCKNKDAKLEKQLPEYQKINTAFFEIIQMNQQDEQRLKQYMTFFSPIMKEIKKQCSELYKNYSKILVSMDNVHHFMKTMYTGNLDFVKKRMKMESWFEYHKYHRIMRHLKVEWLDLIKKQKNSDGKEYNRSKSQNKRPKTDSTNLQF